MCATFSLADGNQVGSRHRVDANDVSVAVDELDLVDRWVSIMDVDDCPLLPAGRGTLSFSFLRITLSCSLNMSRFPWGRFFAGFAVTKSTTPSGFLIHTVGVGIVRPFAPSRSII